MGVRITLTCEKCGKKKTWEEANVTNKVYLGLKPYDETTESIEFRKDNFYDYCLSKDYVRNERILLCFDCREKIARIEDGLIRGREKILNEFITKEE